MQKTNGHRCRTPWSIAVLPKKIWQKATCTWILLTRAIAPNNKDNNFKTTETTMLRGNQNQLLPFPSFNNSFHNRKSETDSKELSKTVAESMGLYMNAAREADFSFSQQGTAGGQGSQEKLYPLCGRAIEDSQSKMTGSPKMKAPPALFPPGAQLPNDAPQECVCGLCFSVLCTGHRSFMQHWWVWTHV